MKTQITIRMGRVLSDELLERHSSSQGSLHLPNSLHRSPTPILLAVLPARPFAFACLGSERIFILSLMDFNGSSRSFMRLPIPSFDPASFILTISMIIFTTM